MKKLTPFKSALLIGVTSTLVLFASAAPVIITDSNPRILFRDTDIDNQNDWGIWGREYFNGEGHFDLFDLLGSNNHQVISIFGDEGASKNRDSLIVDRHGDMRLANGAVSIDRTNMRLGVGIDTPKATLHLSGESSMRLDNPLGYWGINAADNYELVYKNNFDGSTQPKTIMNIEDEDIYCRGGIDAGETAPCIGFFEAINPDASIHIKKNDGNTQLLVEEASGTTAVRSLIKMKNNGAVGFLMEDTAQAVQWEFRSNSAGNFIFNDVGDSAELSLNKNGNMVVKGNIVANGIALTSSRSAKTDFTNVKTNDVMQKLAKIKVEEWRYKEADKSDRHISPMAEDFYSLFRLGPDNKHINPNDLASVAIIAAKELQKKSDVTNAKLEAKTAMLKSENTKLKQELEESTVALKANNASLREQLIAQQKRLTSLEKLVTSLASANGRLNSPGAKVALK